MKLEKITIHNFRSIENLTIDRFYQNKDKSERAFNLLIGLNESGKSSILQAINNVYSSELKYTKTMYKPNVNNAEDNIVEVKIYFEIDKATNKLLQEKSQIFAEQKGLSIKKFDDIKHIIYNFELSSTGIKNNRYYLNSCEFILMLRKGKAKNINNMGTKNILKISNIIGNKTHPTEKPIELMEVLVNNSSQENELVIDPFMGVGSTGLACIKNNRNFIGIEIDENYFNIAKSRLEEFNYD